MKILSLGLDNSILNISSPLARRAILYGEMVEKYTVLTPGKKNVDVKLSEKVIAYGFGGHNKLEQFIKIYNSAKKLLQEDKYNVITVQDQYYLALIGLYLAKRFNSGLEIQVHGFEKYRGLRKLTAKYVLPRANAVRCVNQRLKKRLVNEFGVKEERITEVPIYYERLEPSARRPTREGKNFVFLTVGRLVPVKNIGLQIGAMSEVAKKYPESELWIIGDGAEREELKAKSKKLKADDKIKFFGEKGRAELDLIYQQVDAFLLTSDSEGWGMAVVEAAGFGLPIIMTDVGCAGEVIKDGISGLIIPAGDKQKLIESMLKIIENRGLREKLGADAKLAVSKLPSKERTLELYKKSWALALKK
ncbi:MAG: glycosyltransferase family 4 protein [Patescibacteria group bacterium]|nr:glycosyltransferase family 4 protein [Patescibacteria group bacterium]